LCLGSNCHLRVGPRRSPSNSTIVHSPLA
jgi:hypothetical protein